MAPVSASGQPACVVEARILATLALVGPLELSQLRSCAYLVGPSATALCSALARLVKRGLVDASERSEIALCGGMRCRRDYTLFSSARPEGVRQ